ncbi:hypothetical protein [Halorubrum halodurans]|uniref:Uncharacterized protein n=1 Tax=Halorubrum halodurans TaxID=1383851 RepID=A0A256IED1_9EURY|nr:hypothetical protein [Halorubrum halodurans]OYR54905.1 hypothetical protein DJ70_12815 [Halorubrum halodurans]
MVTFRVDVDGKKVGRQIKRRIEDGVDSAADDINDEMRQVAKGKIRSENAIFTRELISEFTDAKVTFGDSTVASLRNLAQHAPYQEEGVSGTQVQRDTPYKYKDKKPPLDSLIPWVIENLQGSYWPDDLGDPPAGFFDPDGPAPSGSSRSSGSGGVNTSSDSNSGVPIDEDRLYVEEDGFRSHGRNEEFYGDELYPNQRIVVFNENEKEYLRATIKTFGSSDQSFKFELDDVDGSLFKLSNNGAGPWRLIATEVWEELDEETQRERLAGYFDDFISTSYQSWLQPSYKQNYGMTEPDPSAIESARDLWTGPIFDRYKDKSVVREQVRNFEAIVSPSNQSLQSNPTRGGAILDLDGTTRFVGLFLSDDQFANLSHWSLSDRRMVLGHEAKHSLSSVLGYARTGDSTYKALLTSSEWNPSGLQTNADPELPSHAEELLFRDNDNSGKVLGGLGWLKDAYSAAEGGEDGIASYQPDIETGRDQPYRRLHEAANRVWWLQAVAGRDLYREKGDLTEINDASIFVRSTYSAQNAAETLATLEEVMWGEWDEWEDRLEYLVALYPWFVETWLDGHTPPEKVKDFLIELGVEV